MITLSQVLSVLAELDQLAAAVATDLGQPEIKLVADAVTAIAAKFASAASSAAPVLSVEVTAADAAAAAAIAAKFGAGPGIAK